MQNVLIVTAEDGYFAQRKYPWSSMDVYKIKVMLEEKGFAVKLITFDYLKKNIGLIKGNIIIYTSSQRIEHKKYIEDVIFTFSENNTLVPSYESLLAHDNKGFQVILDKKYNLGLIDADYFCDLSEIKDVKELEFPLVYKPANGASSIGVKKVRNYEELNGYNREPLTLSKESIKRALKKYLFKSRFNKKWDDYISFGKKRFLLQSFIPGLQYDYKVLIFADKYYVLKRFVAENDFKASGSGLHSRDIGGELDVVLSFSKDFKMKLKSHIYSLDICIKDGKPFIIEFQLTHVGPVTLTESEHYYTFDKINNVWVKNQGPSDLETEFTTAIIEYVNENHSYSS